MAGFSGTAGKNRNLIDRVISKLTVFMLLGFIREEEVTTMVDRSSAGPTVAGRRVDGRTT